MTNITIKNIGVYLSARHGDRYDYEIILQIYKTKKIDGYGIPKIESIPISNSEIDASIVNHEGWYVFGLEPFISIATDQKEHYSIVLWLKPNSIENPPDFSINYIDWFHSKDKKQNLSVSGSQLYSFSSDIKFGDNILERKYSYGYSEGASIVENGWGYSVDGHFPNEYDYFNIVGFSGLNVGKRASGAIGSYGYGIGFEIGDFVSDSRINRNFKLYGNFNDISFVEGVGPVETDQDYAQIKIPSANEQKIVLNNRQDFMGSSMIGSKIIGDYITLSENGERFYCIDTSAFWKDKNFYFSKTKWNKANLFLSVNDLNDADIFNPSGNLDSFKSVIVSAPYYSGVYYSENGGASWIDKTLDLTINNEFRNIRCVAFDFSGEYIIAIDSTNVDERSKVFTLNFKENLNWEYKGKIGENIKTNCILSIENNTFFVGTDVGVYRTLDGGVSWDNLANGIDCGSKIYDIQRQINGQGIILIASSTGTYAFDSNVSSNPLYGWKKINSLVSYSVCMNSKYLYIGTDGCLLRNVDENFDEIFTTGLTFEGDSSYDKNYYAFGLLDQKITSIKIDKIDESKIYVSQDGGVSISKNDGGNFINISNNLSEKKINKILLNPVNNKIIYVISETTKFSRIGITIILDTSGSSFANDGDGRRIDFLKNVVEEIECQSRLDGKTSYYQLITFGVSEKESKNFKIENDLVDVSGVTNETGGYISDADFIKDKLESFRLIGRHYRTPLNEAISISSQSLQFNASGWSYDSRSQKYKFKKIVSQYFDELDKAVLLVTDGFNTVLSSSIEDLVSQNSSFSRMRGSLYIVGIGHNINYEILKKIKEAHPHGFLYSQPYAENIFNKESDSKFVDASKIILDREKFRKRTGVWNKVIHYESLRKITKIKFNASTPPGTSALLKIRYSEDKNIWSDWSSFFNPNIENDVSLFGKYFEILISLESNSSKYSPEIISIEYTILNPKKSVLLYNSQNISNQNKMKEIIVTAIDDNSLGRIPENQVKAEYNVSQSKTIDTSFFQKINRDFRSVIDRKEYENLIYSDGYFFQAEGGGWPFDSDYSIYDITNGTFEASNKINPSLYSGIPEKGLIIFYNKVHIEKKYAIKINFINTSYRIGTTFTSYTNDEALYRMHDVGVMFLTDRDSSFKNRKALPFVGSQLSSEFSCGFVSPSLPFSAENISNVFSLQYIAKKEYSGGYLSITNGNVIDISIPGLKDLPFRFYDQNFALSLLQINEDNSSGYVRSDLNDKKIRDLSISNTQTIEFKQQIDLSVLSLQIGDSISVIIGDDSYGGNGLPSFIRMNNLLFDQSDLITGEYETSFVAGVSYLADPISTSDSPTTFNQLISPNVQFGGFGSKSLRIIAPTTVHFGSSFNFIVLIVDANGFIDKHSAESIQLSSSDIEICSVQNNEYTFAASDMGQKKFSGIINRNTDSFVVIKGILNGVVFESNPIVTNFDKYIKWGDLNVSTVFSDGRQDIEFAINYAKNTSFLDFIGLSDDIEKIDQDEFDYMRYKSSLENSNSFVCLPGFKYRTKNKTGERVVLFSNAYSLDENISIFDKPSSLGDEESQIINLVNRLEEDSVGWNYVSIPIHTAYSEENSRLLEFANRSFDFKKYKDFLNYGSTNKENINIKKFIKNESVVEIYSGHGNIEDVPESIGYKYGNQNFVGRESSYYVRESLRIGKRFGFIANANNYSTRPGYCSGEKTKYVFDFPSSQNYNKGLTAIKTDFINSDKIIESLKDRSVYATTGARIFINFYLKINKNLEEKIIKMGEVVTGLEKSLINSSVAKYPNVIFIRAIGDKSNISRIIIFKIKVDDNVSEIFLDSANTDDSNFNKIDFGRDTGVLSVTDTDIQHQNVVKSEYIYYVRVEQQDGQIAWASPIYCNYGRVEGIRSSDSGDSNIVCAPLLVGTSLDVSGIPCILNANESQSFPQLHKNILINSDGFPVESVRGTPFENKYLYVGNEKTSISGIRMISESDKIISYGTNSPRFVLKSNDFSVDIKDDLDDLNPGSNSYTYDFLNDENNLSIDRYCDQRDFLFGTMWQYSSDRISFSSLEFYLEKNGANIFSSVGVVKLVKDPFIYFDMENNCYRNVFVTSNSAYPESNLLGQFKYPPDESSIDYDRIKEFAGFVLGDGTSLSRHEQGKSFVLMCSNDLGETRRTFKGSYSEVVVGIDLIGFDRDISYLSSPNIVRVNSEYMYHLYFLGWVLTSDEILMHGMFVRKFNSFSDLSSPGETNICFLFYSSSERIPSSYSNGKTNFNFFNFIPKSLRIQKYFYPVPILSLPWCYLSVVRRKENEYYAFVNFLNRLSDFSEEEDQPGTAILFSSDGINFQEKLLDYGDEVIPILENKMFVHPFEYYGDFYLSYRESLNTENIGAEIRNFPLKIVKFNWIKKFF